METYSSSNAATQYPEERVNLVEKSMNVVIFYRDLENENCINAKKKKKEVVKRNTDRSRMNLEFPTKRSNNPKLPLCHANLFNMPSEY